MGPRHPIKKEATCPRGGRIIRRIINSGKPASKRFSKIWGQGTNETWSFFMAISWNPNKPTPQENDDLINLAQEFVDATVDKWGTDEEAVYRIVKEIHDSGQTADFTTAVSDLIEDHDLLCEISDSGNKSLIPAILSDEMSGSQLARAMDLYTKGRDTYRSSSGDYFLEGLSSTFDLSDTASKVVLGVGVVALCGLAIASAPAAAIAGGVLLVGTAVYGVGSIVKNGVELAFSDSDAEFKENMRDLGLAVGITAITAPFVPKGIQGARSGVVALLTTSSEAPKIQGIAGAINRLKYSTNGDVDKLAEMAGLEMAATVNEGPNAQPALKAIANLGIRAGNISQEAIASINELFFKSDPLALDALSQLFEILKNMKPMDQDLVLTYLPRSLEKASKIPASPEKQVQYLIKLYGRINFWDSMVRPPSAVSYDVSKVLEAIGMILLDDQISLTPAQRVEVLDRVLNFEGVVNIQSDLFIYKDLQPILRSLSQSRGSVDEIVSLLRKAIDQVSFLRENPSVELIEHQAAQGVSVSEITSSLK